MNTFNIQEHPEILELTKKSQEDTLTAIKKRGSLGEFDTHINDNSRNIIKAIIEKFGEAWIYQVNLYEPYRGNRDKIATKITQGQPIYNFSASFVLPTKNETLIDMILKRDQTPYTGTPDDYKLMNDIYAYAEQTGAIILHWV